MNILAFDTSTLRASLALRGRDGEIWTSSTDPAQRHGRLLLPTIQALLDEAGLRANELNAIAVGVGPGSYTGLRVGVVAAKTLAYATGAQLLALDSLEFFARSAPSLAGRLSILIDAQRGDFHVADYDRGRIDLPLRQQGPTRLVSGEALATSWKPHQRIGGPGVTAWKYPWPSEAQVLGADLSNPQVLLTMTDEAIEEGRLADPYTLEPGYFRESSAEQLWRARETASPRSAGE